MDFLSYLKENIVVFDGAFGTMLQKKAKERGIEISTVPELLNIQRPELIEEIHREYAGAGADVITANTFGANEKKAGGRELSEKLVKAAVDIARRAAGNKFVALDIGPVGQLLEPMGSLSFDEAYEIFARQMRAGKGADLILIETMTDLAELKAALLAARENTDLPVICSMTFEQSGRTFTGCAADCFAMTASPLADAVGVNCSLGPKQLLPAVKAILENTQKPVIVQANAGLPDENSDYSVSADEFAQVYKEMLGMGVRVIGGCCGTTPGYIKKLRALADGAKPAPSPYKRRSAVCSATKTVEIDGVRVIGERINPTGKKAMKAALYEGNYGYVTQQALEQTEAGADILDVNAGLPELDEKAVLTKLVKHVQAVCDLPLQIDCGKPDAIEAALRAYTGKAIVNSVNGEDKVLDAILPLAAKYGAAVVGLTMDERGIPKTAKERVKIAEKIIARAKEYGIPEEDVYIDCLTLTVSAEQAQASQTLEAIRQIKKKHRVKTVLGVSNISFGLPNRQIINTAFLTGAMFAGLDLPIINPNIPENMQAVAAFNALTGKDKNCAAYTEKYGAVTVQTSVTGAKGAPAAQTQSGDIFYCIAKGLPEAADRARELLETVSPLSLIDDYLIPALNAVGDDYEKGVLFLPQLISAAESAKLCFDEVKKRLGGSSGAEKGKIVLATVKGDIHDIGKNIVKTVLENYGYKVIDLGKNVPPEEVVRVCREQDIKLCGLSALMTTTVVNMEETIRLLRKECPACRVMVGGAVLNADYAKKIGADWYCKDANADVKIAQYIFGGGEVVPRL